MAADGLRVKNSAEPVFLSFPGAEKTVVSGADGRHPDCFI